MPEKPHTQPSMRSHREGFSNETLQRSGEPVHPPKVEVRKKLKNFLLKVFEHC